MKISGIEFPRPLLDALRDDRLVVFAGAGVSMGAPACLPDFRNLAEAVASGTGEASSSGETEDLFLGRLQQKGTKVHALAAQELSKYPAQFTALHRDLLQLFKEPASTRVVTTNFDLLFEEAAGEVFGSQSDVFSAPALPVGTRFTGIVHVHGSLTRESNMVLTDSDFGRAYLTEGWARRFLVDLFNSYTVLFVGYSHSDVVMNYLARALPSETKRYALTDGKYVDRWQILGIEPIIYDNPSGSHQALYDGVRGLAKHVTRGVLDWGREITEIAARPPPVDDEASDLIDDALSDPIRTPFFTEVATHAEWIGWLERHHRLDSLLTSGALGLSDSDSQLALWLAQTFARVHGDELFHLLGRHNLQIHPILWLELGRAIGSGQGEPMDPSYLSRWVSLLLETAPPMWKGQTEIILSLLGALCHKEELTDSLLDIFTKMTTNQLKISSLPPFMESPAVDDLPSVYPEAEPAFDRFSLEEFWRLRLNPQLDQVAEPLLSIVVQNLVSQHRILGAWGSANQHWDATSFARSAIERHEQDQYPQAIDTVIDIARECLEYLASNRRVVASNWCDRLVSDDAPILRRLAVHLLSLRQDLTADQKVDWLLANIGLHDLSARHETFQILRAIYPDVSLEKRRTVINDVLAYESPDADDPERERRAAYDHFRWLHWLQESDLSCGLTKGYLAEFLARNPGFQPQEHPDLTVYRTDVGFRAPQSPWSVSELLSRPAAEWADRLVSFREEDPLGPDRDGLLLAVEKATIEEFGWGIALADTLAKSGYWEADLWPPLMRAWSHELDVEKHEQALDRLGNDKLYSIHARPVAEALLALVKNDRILYDSGLMTTANQLATALWDYLDRGQPTPIEADWWLKAMNHPAGVLTDFWLRSIALWRGQQQPRPVRFGDPHYSVLSKVVQDTTPFGTLGKAVLASRLGFILAADENWAKQYLIPLFDCEDSDDRQAVWDGFLYGPLSPQVAEALKHAFVRAVQSMETLLPSEGYLRQRFVEDYAWMATFFVDDPLESWIPKLFHKATAEDRRQFARVLGKILDRMDLRQRQEWWERWLRVYWEKRLQGVPVPLDAGEVEAMLRWLPYLDRLFPDAVELAIQMPPGPLEHNSLIYAVSSGELWSKYPEATAKLIIHLAEFEAPQWTWQGAKELIDNLLTFDLPDELKVRLNALPAKRGL